MKILRVMMMLLFAASLAFAGMQTIGCGTKVEDPNKCDPVCSATQECKAGKCVDKTKVDPNKCDPACSDTQECKAGKCTDKATSKPAP